MDYYFFKKNGKIPKVMNHVCRTCQNKTECPQSDKVQLIVCPYRKPIELKSNTSKTG